MKNFKFYLVCAFYVISMKSYSQEFKKSTEKYFCICGKCAWVSPTTSSRDDAKRMGTAHQNAQSGHPTRTAAYDPNVKATWADLAGDWKFKSVCGKCSWVSPTTTNSDDADGMGIVHQNANTGHRCNRIRE